MIAPLGEGVAMGSAIENLIKWVGALAPFLAPYPSWVKIAFVTFVLSGAALFVGLVVAAPKATPGSGAETAWLTLKGVTAFGRGSGVGVRVTATVNGIEYIYPSLPGVDWLEIGPEMAPQSFQIPIRDIYTIRFSARLRDGRDFVSVEEQRVKGNTDGIKTYDVHALDRGQRAAPVTAQIRYTISRDSP
jgi:hypothetical protein